MKRGKETLSNLISRDGARCAICGKKLTDGEMTIDHIFPRLLGGSDDLDNLRIVCRRCNCEAASRTFIGLEFERYIYEVISKSDEFRNVKPEWEMENPIADFVAERKKEDKKENKRKKKKLQERC